VSNAVATPITGVRATLVPRSGGFSVTQPFASYSGAGHNGHQPDPVPDQPAARLYDLDGAIAA